MIITMIAYGGIVLRTLLKQRRLVRDAGLANFADGHPSQVNVGVVSWLHVRALSVDLER